MAASSSILHTSDPFHNNLISRQQDVLLRLASLDPRELCSEALIEKCRATRDLRSCGRTVKHALTSCNHASLCAECGQRCDVCPTCRVPINRDGSPMRLRLFEECLEVGLISSKDEQSCEKDGLSNASVQRLWLIFDVALENKLVSLIRHYVADVCLDDTAVSSNAIVALLLDGTVVVEWCRRTFSKIIRNLQDIYSLETSEMRGQLGEMEKCAAKLTGLSDVLESLESPNSDETSSTFLELQKLVESIGRAAQHLDVMCWCAKHEFLENIHSHHATFDDWKNAFERRKSAADSRVWPDQTINPPESVSSAHATLFIEDALENIGIRKNDESDSLAETLELGYLKQTTSFAFYRSDATGALQVYPAPIYPPNCVRDAVDMIFLDASADVFIAKKAIFLYYLIDRQWPHNDSEWKLLLDDYMFMFDISRHAMLESMLFFLLDECSDKALEEACCLLPEVVSSSIHPKIARVFLERNKPKVALDVLYCSGGDGALKLLSSAEVPALEDAMTAVRVRLECGLLTEAFLYQRSYISRVKAKAQENKISKARFNHEDSCRESSPELLVGEICWLCMQKNLLHRMIELPWQEDEERIIVKCLLEQATQDPCTMAGSLMVIFYVMRCRYREVYVAHKRLSVIESSFIAQCGDREKSDLVKSICSHRTKLVEKCLEMLPEIQREELRNGALDDLLTFYGERGSSAKLDSDLAMESIPPKDEFSATILTSPVRVTQKSLLDFPKPFEWENYGQPSSLRQKALDSPFGSMDLSSPLTRSFVTPKRQQDEGLLSSNILGRKLIFNGETNAMYNGQRSGISGMDRTTFSVSNDSLGPIHFSDHIKASLQDGTPRKFNQKGQNALKVEDESATFFRWLENGSAKKDESFSSAGKFKHRKQAILTSPNGKRKAPEFVC